MNFVLIAFLLGLGVAALIAWWASRNPDAHGSNLKRRVR